MVSYRAARGDDGGAFPRIRLCFFGDSITVGVGDSRWWGWPQRLCASERERGCELTPYILGVRGDTSAEIRSRWLPECRQRLVEPWAGGIVFCFGVNDTCDRDGVRQVPLPLSIENARATVGAANALKPVFWIAPLPVDARSPVCHVEAAGVQHEFRNERIIELTGAFDAVAAELGVPFLDAGPVLRADADLTASLAASDGIHPDDRGHHCIASTIRTSVLWRRWIARLEAPEKRDEWPAPSARHEFQPGSNSP